MSSIPGTNPFGSRFCKTIHWVIKVSENDTAKPKKQFQ